MGYPWALKELRNSFNSFLFRGKRRKRLNSHLLLALKAEKWEILMFFLDMLVDWLVSPNSQRLAIENSIGSHLFLEKTCDWEKKRDFICYVWERMLKLRSQEEGIYPSTDLNLNYSARRRYSASFFSLRWFIQRGHIWTFMQMVIQRYLVDLNKVWMMRTIKVESFNR